MEGVANRRALSCGTSGEVRLAIRREGEIAIKELEYDEFEVLLERSGDGYTARVVDSPTGPVPALPFVPPEPPGGLPALRLAVRGERRLTSGAVTPSPKEFGASLFRALFNDKALAILRTSQYVSAKRQRGLRLRLRFADATSLANLPWELLYDPERHWYPCQLSRFPTLRLVDLPEPVLPLRVSGPLRMLVVISSPIDLPALEVEREWTLLRTELDPLVQSGRLELERLSSASLEDVRETLMHRDFHIFHYIGHGGVDVETGEGHLAFTGPDGRQRRVSGGQLGVMLSNAPIRLAVLNSCEGGRVSDVDPYASTAIALVEQGIPAVVAMQFQITDAAATAFSRTFYDSVTAGRPVDLSVTLARQAVLAASESEWATPVLYLRAVDGLLFDLETRAEPPAAASVPSGPLPYVTKPVRRTDPTAKPAPPSPGVPAAHEATTQGSVGGPQGGPAAMQGPAEERPLVFGQPARRKSRKGWVLLLLVAAAVIGFWLVLRPTNTPVVSAPGATRVQPPSVVSPAVAPSANLSLTQKTPGDAGGSNEKTLSFTTSNKGPNTAENESVTVSIPNGGSLLVVTARPPHSSGARECGVTDGRTATCFVGDHDVGDIVEVVVIVLVDARGVTVEAMVTSDTADPDLSNNSARYPS